MLLVVLYLFITLVAGRFMQATKCIILTAIMVTVLAMAAIIVTVAGITVVEATIQQAFIAVIGGATVADLMKVDKLNKL